MILASYFPPVSRLEYLGIEAGCVNNPCSDGEVPWANGECYLLEEEGAGLNCSSHLTLSEESQRIGCDSAIVPLSVIIPTKRDCGVGKVWFAPRRKCVPCFNKSC